MSKTNNDALNQAEQQLLGFHHRNCGYDIGSLCEAMGLSEEEYKELKKEGMITYLTDEEIEDIEEYLFN